MRMQKRTDQSHQQVSGQHYDPPRGGSPAVVGLDAAIDQLNDHMQDLAQRCQASHCDVSALTAELSAQIHRVEAFCRAAEQELMGDEAIRQLQESFRQRTQQYFGQSYLMNRARTWPRGYPGDYEIIDAAYDGQPLSRGIGELLDRYFLSTTLAHAIQRRREKMRDMLADELRNRPAARVLNIGCGPCREVLELAPLIRDTQAHFVNVDFDPDALMYSAKRLIDVGIKDHVEFRQYNAIRMVNTRKTVREFGRFDVIYTIGLLDYLSDDILVRLLKTLHETLNPQGVLIAVFKDCEHYATEDYHWLVNWSAFRQRTGAESCRLLQQAGIGPSDVTTSRTSDEVMIFYRVLQTAALASRLPLHGPHDRRQLAGDTPRSSDAGSSQTNRPSWHRPTQPH